MICGQMRKDTGLHYERRNRMKKSFLLIPDERTSAISNPFLGGAALCSVVFCSVP